jgi:hypothetical protein
MLYNNYTAESFVCEVSKPNERNSKMPDPMKIELNRSVITIDKEKQAIIIDADNESSEFDCSERYGKRLFQAVLELAMNYKLLQS